MTRAEEAANIKYPFERGIDTLMRIGFIEGYQQAEKDLALTWEDILAIVKISEQLKRDEWRDKKVFCKEILKRFNETRK